MANLLEGFVMFIIFILAIGFNMSKAEVYKVGGVAGWTNIGQADYKTWASSKNFSVGDVIVFQYNTRFHNVVRVSHQDFKACSSDKAYKTFTSGHDSFVVQSPGHFYFTCSVSDHCKQGQRIDIRVPKEDAAARAQSPATRSIAEPPVTAAQPPYKSHPPNESHPPAITIPSPPPGRPPATSQTTSDSTSSVNSFRYCMIVFTLISCFFLGMN